MEFACIIFCCLALYLLLGRIYSLYFLVHANLFLLVTVLNKPSKNRWIDICLNECIWTVHFISKLALCFLQKRLVLQITCV